MAKKTSAHHSLSLSLSLSLSRSLLRGREMRDGAVRYPRRSGVNCWIPKALREAAAARGAFGRRSGIDPWTFCRAMALPL